MYFKNGNKSNTRVQFIEKNVTIIKHENYTWLGWTALNLAIYVRKSGKWIEISRCEFLTRLFVCDVIDKGPCTVNDQNWLDVILFYYTKLFLQINKHWYKKVLFTSNWHFIPNVSLSGRFMDWKGISCLIINENFTRLQ